MKKIIKKHPLAIRWNHWINFPVLAVMIWSGMLIYWANDVYKIRLGGTVIFRFFPDAFYKDLGLSYRLAEGMAFHFVFMWIFFLNGLAYVLYTLISGEWRLLVPDRRSFREAWMVLLHDLHIRKGPLPETPKYNGAQKIAYTSIIVMGMGSVFTGLAIYKPVQFHWLCALFGGYETARILHFILTIGYCLFFLIHISQVIMAGWNNFRAMVAGFEVIRVEPALQETIAETEPILFGNAQRDAPSPEGLQGSEETHHGADEIRKPDDRSRPGPDTEPISKTGQEEPGQENKSS